MRDLLESAGFTRPVKVFLHRMRVSSVEVEARDCRSSVDAELLGHAVQVGQSEVNTAHRQHGGLKQVDVPVVVTGNLKAE